MSTLQDFRRSSAKPDPTRAPWPGVHGGTVAFYPDAGGIGIEKVKESSAEQEVCVRAYVSDPCLLQEDSKTQHRPVNFTLL